MGYILYSLTFTSFILASGRLTLIGSPPPMWSPRANQLSALYLTRNRWTHLIPIDRLPLPDYIYTRLPSSFSSDMESGLTSSDFDLSANVASNDSRAGLDQQAKREVQKIMKSRKVGFDEARRLYTEGRFAKNNIGPDGRPRDPKFVSFS